MSVEYDRMAEVYRRHRRCLEGVLRALVDGGRLNGDSRVLEIGAGTGNYVAALRELVGCRCAAVEPSSGMRAVAETNAVGVEVVAGAAERLPFEAGSFDFAFSVNVMHHIEERPASFREAFRVLSASGVLCVATESHEMIRNRFVLPTYFPETVEVDIARYSSPAELRRMAEDAGFSSWGENITEVELVVESPAIYEEKAFSCLHLIPEAAFQAGLERLKRDLAQGPMRAVVPALALFWATK